MVVAVGPSHLPGKSVIWPSEEGKLRLGKGGWAPRAFWVPRRAAAAQHLADVKLGGDMNDWSPLPPLLAWSLSLFLPVGDGTE